MGRIDIKVKGTLGTYATTVVPDPLKAQPFEDVDVFFDVGESDIQDAVFSIRFYKEKADPDKKKYDKGCLLGGDGKGKHVAKSSSPGFKKIDDKVEATPQHPAKSFFYSVWYTDLKGDHMLVDPEIVVEGDPPRPPIKAKSTVVAQVDQDDHTPPKRKAKKKPAKRKKPTKKQPAKKKKKPAKKKKANKAKRSTKRKAKKR